MNKCKVLAVLILVVMLVSALSIVVFAKPEAPYSDNGLSLSIGWFGGADTASAFITRCSCLPVINYLAVHLNCQYEDGNDNIWDPGPDGSRYTMSSGNDVNEISLSKSHHYIQYTSAMFNAQCRDGSMVILKYGRQR